jgi:hypothetical protein
VVLLIIIATHATLGCDEEYKTCYPGDYLGCTCPNGQPGFAACANEAYGQCVCDGTTPGLDAGGTRDAAVANEGGGRNRDAGDAGDAAGEDASAAASDAGDAGDAQ